MIFVDTSVWIDLFRRKLDQPHVVALDLAMQADRMAPVGDLVLYELLSGAGSEARADVLQRELAEFRIEPMVDPRLVAIAARNFRTLRRLGVTIRRSIDVLIGAFCIDRGYTLLHNDRDFLPMATHLGLRVIDPAV